MVHERRKPRPCGSLLDILTGLTNTTCDEPPRAVSSRLGRRSPIGTQATHACCFIPKPRTYSTPTCIESHANEPWQVVAAVAAVRSTKDEKIVLVIAPDYEASRARGFVLRSLELQSLA
ncbi:hypothetical protein Tco_1476242 [Tanacetum coccineum]